MKTLALLTTCAFLLAQHALAQDTAPAVAQDTSGNAIAGGPPQPNDAATPPVQVGAEGPLARWLTMNTFSFSYRWRDLADSNNYRLFDTGQERTLIDGRFKLDAEGKYSVNFHVSSGRYFNWAYADSIGKGFGDSATGSLGRYTPAELGQLYGAIAADPVGTADITNHLASRGWETYFRQLYFSATPIKQVTLEYGGLGIERGVNTEITSYDEDGYLAGERLRLRDPQHLYFDQIAVTYGYLGDYFVPNFFDRGDRLAQSNYHQFLVEKNFGHRLKASADYTWQNRTDTLREAVLVKVPESRILDSARLELYQRTDAVSFQGETFGTGAGFAFTGSKTFAKKFQLEGGYDTVDQNYADLAGSRVLAISFAFNGDSYSIGPRFFTRANYRIDPYFTLFGFYTHALATDYYMLNRQGMNFGLTVDLKNFLDNKFHLGIAPVKVDN